MDQNLFQNTKYKVFFSIITICQGPNIFAWRVHSTHKVLLLIFELFYARSENCEKRVLASSSLSVCLSIRPSVHKEHLGSHWKDFHEMLLKMFRKSFETIHVWLHLNNDGCYISSLKYICNNINNISPNSSCNEKRFAQSWEKIKTLLFSGMENFNRERALYHIRRCFLFPFLSRNITVTYSGISGWSGYVARMRSSEIQTKA